MTWFDFYPDTSVPYPAVVGTDFQLSVLSPLVRSNVSTAVAVNTAGWPVSVTAPWAIAFPSAFSSNSTQILNFSGGSFSIEDLKGATAWYYVTLSMSNLADSGGHAINKNNISVTVPGASVSNFGRSSNPAVTVPASAGTVGAGYVSLGSATTLL